MTEVKYMKIEDFTVKAAWDEEAQVFVATSEDVPGLTLEADTLDEVRKEATLIIPTILELNGQASTDKDQIVDMTLEVETTVTKIAI